MNFGYLSRYNIKKTLSIKLKALVSFIDSSLDIKILSYSQKTQYLFIGPHLNEFSFIKNRCWSDFCAFKPPSDHFVRGSKQDLYDFNTFKA